MALVSLDQALPEDLLGSSDPRLPADSATATEPSFSWSSSDDQGRAGGSFDGVEMRWRCSTRCGAYCKRVKDPNFSSLEEIFSEDHQLVQHVESMIGPKGWCKHYDHASRTCAVYSERPFFYRVEPEVLLKLFSIDEKSFNSEMCRGFFLAYK